MIADWVTVIEKSASRLLAEMPLTEKYPYFEGHFSGIPVLAGVVQLGLVMRLLETEFKVSLRFRELKVVKFTRLVRPPCTLKLDIEFDSENARAIFKIFQDEIRCASGQIFFEQDLSGA